jgi:hypothetical protein
VASVSTAVAAVAALYFSTQSLRATQSQYGLSQQGQIADRFAKSIEQLGSQTAVDVRLGGIYSLERIARDSSPDRPVVFEVLGAFVRTHSPNKPGCGMLEETKPKVDVQAALTVIGRRVEGQGVAEPIDLSSTCLGVVSLLHANLTSAYLFGSDLFASDLTGANLSGADLPGADLTDVILARANLTGANLLLANLTTARLPRADLTGANLTAANLAGASLLAANLTHADLTHANLTGATLTDADVTDANLTDIYYDDRTVWPVDFVPPKSRPNR